MRTYALNQGVLLINNIFIHILKIKTFLFKKKLNQGILLIRHWNTYYLARN